LLVRAEQVQGTADAEAQSQQRSVLMMLGQDFGMPQNRFHHQRLDVVS
jgi:hypothetical protein